MGDDDGEAQKPGSLAGQHPDAEPFQMLVGPSMASEFNTVRLRPIPVACWRMDDVRFDFDSSFVLPGVKNEIRLLAELIKEQTGTAAGGNPSQPPPISIFGHADPVGKDEYNKSLSGRRAVAVYGMLTRRAEVWEDLFSSTGVFARPAAGDQWGLRAIQIALRELGIAVATDGKDGPQTQAAVREFQQKNGLAPDGAAGPATRNTLFLAYMDQLCVDESGAPFRVDRVKGFLARNQDATGKGDFQGCGEFNPLLIFSERTNTAFERDEDKTKRNEANAPNRRVMVLLFRPGSRVLPEKWPCPRAREGVSGCVKRLWSDSDRRRNSRLPDKPRTAEENEDTFGCRFYDRLTANSPCEKTGELVRLRMRLIDSLHRPIKNAKYTLVVGSLRFADVTDAEGRLSHLVPSAAKTGKLQIESWTAALDILPLGNADEPRGARLRMENLGLAAVDSGAVRSAGITAGIAGEGADELLRRAILRFQSMVDLELDGILNKETVAKLKETYGS